jgi:hypothetical protein
MRVLSNVVREDSLESAQADRSTRGQTLEMAERVADQPTIDQTKFWRNWSKCGSSGQKPISKMYLLNAANALRDHARDAAEHSLCCAIRPARVSLYGVGLIVCEPATIAGVLRENIASPLARQRKKLCPISSSVISLAKAAYTDRAFDRLPILADALEEAGCTDAEVLAHCRGEGPHVRGCWVVDLILGKE